MEFLTTGDGLRLHLQRWPAPGAAHGTVQIVHGLGEHIGRYEALAAGTWPGTPTAAMAAAKAHAAASKGGKACSPTWPR